MNPETIRKYERQLIGCAIRDSLIVEEVLLKPDDFQTRFARAAWAVVLRLALNGEPVTSLTINEQDKSVLVSDLEAAHDDACLPSQAAFFAAEIRKFSLRNRIARACESALTALRTDIPIDDTAEIVETLFDVLLLDTSPNELAALTELVDRLVNDLASRRERGHPGIPTRLEHFDFLTGGLRPGSFIVIAAETGIGKSLLASSMVLSAQVPTLLFSLEMAGLEVAERMVAQACGISAARLAHGMVEPCEIVLHPDHAQRIFIDDNPTPTLEAIVGATRRLKRQKQLQLVVVDYLQIVSTPREERREAEVARIARGLRALARDQNVAVLSLSQLNREGLTRDSAAIEHEAHVVAILDRKRGEQGARLFVKKNRHGPEGLIQLHFDTKTLRIREVES